MAAAQYWQENTFWMQVELSQEMINLKQAEAEKRRSAVQKNSFGQNYMKPSSCCCCSLSSSFSSWPREQKVLAHQAQQGWEVPRALVASTRWLFFIHTAIFHRLINDDCNISSFQCCCFYKKTFIHCIYLCRGLSSQQSRDT